MRRTIRDCRSMASPYDDVRQDAKAYVRARNGIAPTSVNHEGHEGHEERSRQLSSFVSFVRFVVNNVWRCCGPWIGTQAVSWWASCR